MENKHSVEELIQKQSLPLNAKIALTKQRIREFCSAIEGGAYISFSGGKDSTVLLHIAREVYPDIPAVFFNTGLEFPEVVSHVKTFNNVTMVRPELTFKQVIDKFGWVYPNKDVAEKIYYARSGTRYAVMAMQGLNLDGSESWFRQRYKRWEWLIGKDVLISHRCCDELKKKPAHKFAKKTGLKPIVATLAEESNFRKQAWLKVGCNSFVAGCEMSKPMSFWTEQDVLSYIKQNSITIPTIYGDIVEVNKQYKCSLRNRTGCIFCPIACHLEKTTKFMQLKETHPKLYKYCLDTLGERKLLDILEEHFGRAFY